MKSRPLRRNKTASGVWEGGGDRRGDYRLLWMSAVSALRPNLCHVLFMSLGSNSTQPITLHKILLFAQRRWRSCCLSRDRFTLQILTVWPLKSSFTSEKLPCFAGLSCLIPAAFKSEWNLSSFQERFKMQREAAAAAFVEVLVNSAGNLSRLL